MGNRQEGAGQAGPRKESHGAKHFGLTYMLVRLTCREIDGLLERHPAYR